MINVPKVYVLHVNGVAERYNHIVKELGKHDISFEWILEGDLDNIDQDILDKYFIGDLKTISPQTSCTIKHLKAYERLIQSSCSHALIFEDDIELFPSFTSVFNKSIKEINSKGYENLLVSYEDTTLKYISAKEKIHGQLLYKKEKGRCAGAYLIDLKAAHTIINYTLTTKCSKVIDWHHNEMLDKQLLSMYWCEPAIAEQGSHNGKVSSLIFGKKSGLINRLGWSLKRLLKGKVKE